MLLSKIKEKGSSGFLVGGTGHERASKRAHLRTVDRWNADWGALALMVERWLVPLIPFPSYKLCASDRPGAVKGARFARRSEPLTARTDLESYEGEGKGILQPSSHLPTKNPEEPRKEPIASLRTEVMTPSEFGRYLGVSPINPYICELAESDAAKSSARLRKQHR